MSLHETLHLLCESQEMADATAIRLCLCGGNPKITTVGYAGMLVGPAAIGFIAELSSLDAAFLLIAAGMLFVAFSSRLFPR